MKIVTGTLLFFFVRPESLVRLINGNSHQITKRDSALNESLIIGGQDVSIRQYPYMVYMLLAVKPNYYNDLCGGTILNQKYILTAGNCLIIRPINISVTYGYTRFEEGKHHYTNVYYIHPQFNNKTVDYDVGLVAMATDMILDGNNSKPVVLAMEGDKLAPQSLVTITGWGSHTERNNIQVAGSLKAVTVAIVDTSLCTKLYATSSRASITPRMMCVGDVLKGGKSSCYGDMGGPAIDSNGVQVGIVSWAVGCARADHPAVFTNVASIRSWVRQVAGV